MQKCRIPPPKRLIFPAEGGIILERAGAAVPARKFQEGRERMNSRITVVCGHYGCGKTNLALNLAAEAAAKGRRSVIVDMDIVNPYFRSSEYGAFLERHGVQLIAPVFANTTLDTPVLPPEIYSIFSMEDTDAVSYTHLTLPTNSLV